MSTQVNSSGDAARIEAAAAKRTRKCMKTMDSVTPIPTYHPGASFACAARRRIDREVRHQAKLDKKAAQKKPKASQRAFVRDQHLGPE
jgi:hypothetical protein